MSALADYRLRKAWVQEWPVPSRTRDEYENGLWTRVVFEVYWNGCWRRLGCIHRPEMPDCVYEWHALEELMVLLEISVVVGKAAEIAR